MSEYVIYGLFLLAGGLVSYLLFGRGGPGPFEKTIWAGLYEGKRVVVSIGDEAFIFEMINNRLRITRGTSEYMENPDESVASNLGSGGSSKSTDSTASSL